MQNLIIQFAATCRSGDLRVSTAEVIDCVRQLQWVDALDETQFKTTLRSNFAKSRRDQRNFDRLYALFFHDMQTGDHLSPDAHQAEEVRALVDQLKADADEADPIDAALLDFLAGNPGNYLQEMQRLENQNEYTPKGLKSNLGQLSSRLEVMLRLNNMRGQVGRMQTGSGGGGPPTPSEKDAADQVAQRLDRAYRMLTEEVRPHNDGLTQVRSHQKHYEQLGERPFSSLSPAEIEEMRDVIKQLVRKLKDKMSRRYAAKNKGILDVKKTLRHAGRFQGVPIEIKYRNRPLRKTKIVTLCDVSGSVWSAARFMLNMIYSMQDCFSAVHSFAFVSGTTDITEIFEKNEINQAIERVMSDPEIDFNALTDYGEVFYQFKRDHMHLVNKKTTVIIVGDGRSNYHNPREQVLADIREKCRRIIWLNPEAESFWGTGDSEMHTYKAFCHELRPCQNLNQLIDFIEDLVL